MVQEKLGVDIVLALSFLPRTHIHSMSIERAI